MDRYEEVDRQFYEAVEQHFLSRVAALAREEAILFTTRPDRQRLQDLLPHLMQEMQEVQEPAATTPALAAPAMETNGDATTAAWLKL